MRKLYWYLSTYIKKHGWVLALSIGLALILFSFTISIIAQKLERKSHRYVGVIGKFTLGSLPEEIQHKLSAGLTLVEDDDTVTPYLAERWLVEDGGKTYRFVIKKDIRWQDGQELVPADIQYNFPDVETITTPNDIIFKLPDEFVPFPSVVSQPVLRQAQEKYGLFFKRPTLVGVGEYQLEDYKRDGQQLTEITLDSPTEKIIYRFYFTEENAVLAFKRGEVDELVDLSSTYSLDSWPNVTVTENLRPDRYLAIFLNNASPLFAKNVRQALSYALKKPAGTIRAYGPINPNSWAYLEGGKSYDQDLDRATERLLDELPPEPLNFELTTTQSFADQAEEIKQQWEEFGKQAFVACNEDDDLEDKDKCVNAQISVSIRVTNFPDTSNFETMLIVQQIPADPDQYRLWHSEQSTNFTHYKNTRIDALLEKGRKTPEKAERLAIYQEFQQFFLEDAPVIFLSHPISYYLTRN